MSPRDNTTTVDNTALPDEALATNTEAVPVKYLAGETRCSVNWISPIYDRHAIEAPSEAGKK